MIIRYWKKTCFLVTYFGFPRSIFSSLETMFSWTSNPCEKLICSNTQLCNRFHLLHHSKLYGILAYENQWPSKAKVYFIFVFFVVQNSTQIDVITPPHTLHLGRVSSATSLLPQPPTPIWLLCFPSKFGPQKANTPLSLYFFMRQTNAITSPHTLHLGRASSATSLLPRPLTSIWLLCVKWFISGRLRPSARYLVTN